MLMRKLPLGGQGFVEIIDEDYLYADKTQYIYELVTSGMRHYFLSRPSRFGKSLLISTLKELFTGERRRFKGLWIDRSDYDFPRLPVVYLNLSMEPDANFEDGLIKRLSHVADENDLKITATPESSEYLTDLVIALHKKYQSKVAVLIDECDVPVTRNLDKPELAMADAEALCDFLATLKYHRVSERVDFTLVTGVTSYPLTSMDWGRSYLHDVSLDPRCAGICGFTVDELEPLFADRLEGTLARLKDSGGLPPSATIDDLRASIQDWYGGYNWGGKTRVLNPFSTLKFFDQAAFGPYWPDSCRPGYLNALIKARPTDFLAPALDLNLTCDVKRGNIDHLLAVPVLFHSGFLTMVKIIPPQPFGPETFGWSNFERITFRFPNREVESSYHADCLRVILELGSAEELTDKGVKICEAIWNRDFETLERELELLFSAINRQKAPASEADFLALVKSFLMGLGLEALPEVPGLEGRQDLLGEPSDREYVVIGLRRLKGEDPLNTTKNDRFA
jgi:hypothetical protein